MIDRDCLKAGGEAVGVPVDTDLAERLDTYARLLVEWNEKMNLTAITEPGAMVVKHFVDSLAAAPLLPAGPLHLIDVGTGAGFPGVPLALYRRDIQLTLLDSLNKRLVFLEALCRELDLPVKLVHARAEEGGRRPELRERYDVASARAVAALPTLCEYCLPFVRPGGIFLAMKGPEGETEQTAAANAVRMLGGKVRRVKALTLPALPDGEPGGERRILVIDKIAPTPPKYPRPSAKIAKQPL